MRNLTLTTLLILSFILSAQQKEKQHKGLPPSHHKLPNYDYTESFVKESTDNLALLIHNIHVSLMAFRNSDSTVISRPVIYLNGKDASIQSLTNYKQNEVDKIEVKFLPHDILTALYGTSTLNGYGVIRIQLKETKD